VIAIDPGGGGGGGGGLGGETASHTCNSVRASIVVS